jgi:hypothetical protein
MDFTKKPALAVLMALGVVVIALLIRLDYVQAGVAGVLVYLFSYVALRARPWGTPIRVRAWASSMPGLFLVLLSLSLTLLLLLGVDRFIARPMLLANNHAELIFAPHTTHRYLSGEFDTLATINNLGFRGAPIEIRRSDRMRIVAIGDSFTFGYGVGDEETWPFHLEQDLKRAGLDVEVLNLGRPGAGPRGYEIIAANALPLLKPDLVLLGILQCEDLNSSYGGPIANSDVPLHWTDPYLLRVCRRVLPNLMTLATLKSSNARKQRQSQSPPPASAKKPRDSWEKKCAGEMLEALSEQDRARFEALPEDIRHAFREGMINPANIQLALNFPEIYASPELDSPDSSNLQDRSHEMTRSLEKIAATADRHNAAILAVLVPHAALASPKSMANSARLGFATDPKMLSGTQSQNLVRENCKNAGIPFLSTLWAFRKAAKGELLFYPMDQHFNPRGTEVFAAQIAPDIAACLRAIQAASR